MSQQTKREQLLELARSMLHVVEDDGKNRDKAGWIARFWLAARDRQVDKWLGRTPSEAHRDEWCAAFVSWLLEQIGMPMIHADGSGFTGAGRMIQWLEKAGYWYDTTNEPAPGDILFIDWGKYELTLGPDEPLDWRRAHDQVDHVGLVEAYDPESGIIATIEGNYKGGVNRGQRDINGGLVLGFGCILD